MFCTSLRRRPSYASAIPSLTSTEGLRLRENKLDIHDLEIPLKNPARGNESATNRLRVLLFSPSSVTEKSLPDTLERIHHFAALTGGQHLAIIFLLNPPKASTFVSAKSLTADNTTHETDTKGVLAYSKLQASLLPRNDIPHVPILPLASVEDLPQLVKNHSAALSHNITQQAFPAASPFELLQLCTTEPPMDRQTAFLATDCFASLKDLAAACTESVRPLSSSSPVLRDGSGSECHRFSAGLGMGTGVQGKMEQLRSLVGDEKCRELVDFWTDEWVVD